MKRCLLFLMILFLIPAFACPFAAEDDLCHVYSAENNNQAAAIQRDLHINAYFVYDEGDPNYDAIMSDLMAKRSYGENYFIFTCSKRGFGTRFPAGRDDIYHENDRDYLNDTVLSAMTESGNDIDDAAEVFFSACYNMFANRMKKPYRYVIDEAGVLSDAEEKSLNDQLTAFCEDHSFELVVLTTIGVDPEYRDDFADDYYGSHGYGYGDEKTGALLLVNIGAGQTYEAGNSYISTIGGAIDIISDDDISKIGAELTPLLVDGRYADAFQTYYDLVSDNFGTNRGIKIVIIVAVTLIVCLSTAFIYTGSLKKQLKSVENARDANNYLVNGSLNISRSYDSYLYSHVTKIRRSSNNSSRSSHSSSTHRSSSGTTHGGGGF